MLKHTLIAAAGLVFVGILGVLSVARDGNLSYDDSQYLTRGYYHARQAQLKGDWPLPRLGYSLSFEAPRPPWLIGWIAFWKMLLGDPPFDLLLVLSTTVPFLLVSLMIVVAGASLCDTTTGYLSLLCYWSCYCALAFSQLVMVETFCALWVLCVGLLAAQVMSQPTVVRGVLLGLCAGLGILTKLSVVPMVLVPLGFAAVYLLRVDLKAAVKVGLAVLLTAVLVAGLWYLKNGQAAWDHAVFSASFDEHCGSADYDPSRPRRAVDLTVDGFGPGVLLALGSLLLAAPRARLVHWLRSPEPGSAFLKLTLPTIAVTLVLVMIPSYYETRFVLPLTALASVAAGICLRHSCWEGGWLRGGVVVVLLAVGVGVSLLRIVNEPARQAHWEVVQDLNLLGAQGDRSRVGIVGFYADWNVYKLEMYNEFTTRPQRLEFVDLSAFDGEKLAARVPACDAILIVNDIPASRRQEHMAAQTVRELLARPESGFRRLRTDEEEPHKPYTLFVREISPDQSVWPAQK